MIMKIVISAEYFRRASEKIGNRGSVGMKDKPERSSGLKISGKHPYGNGSAAIKKKKDIMPEFAPCGDGALSDFVPCGDGAFSDFAPCGDSALKVRSAGKSGADADRGYKAEPSAAVRYPWHSVSPQKSESLETGDIAIEASAPQGKPQKFDWISVVLQPLGGLLGVVVILVVMTVLGVATGGLFMLVGAVTGVFGILWGVVRYRKQKKEAGRQEQDNEEKYHEYLRQKEEEIRSSADAQLRVMNAAAPSAAVCAGMNERSSVLWSRSINDRNFLSLRVGSGSVDLLRRIRVPEKRYAEENALTEEARSLAEKYRKIENAPICCALRAANSLGIIGGRSAVVDQAIALVTEAAALHSYEDLKIVLLYPAAEAELWRPARFLPHVFDNDREQRYMAENREQADALLKTVAKVMERRQAAKSDYSFSADAVCYPHYLIVVADMSYLTGNSYGKMLCSGDDSLEVSCIFLANRMSQLPQQCHMIAELTEDKAELYDKAHYNEAIRYRQETVTPEQWKGFITALAPIRLENPTVMKGLPRSVSFFEAYGITKPEELDLRTRWSAGHPESSMNVTIGAGQGGETVGFDIHPNRRGAHGIFVGGTASGKTTMVRAWVLSMAATFSPERVTFVLVDFKEPGLLTGLKALPHVVGTVGKLDVDIERNLTALKSEIRRRQKVYAAADAINIYDYLEKHYSGDPSAAEPMPFLYIVVDELNEFKMWSRDGAGGNWMMLLDQLYQTGSALGVHIIAGSQTPGPFSPVMFSNAHFRWCLRTNEPGDSKMMLGNTDAFDIRTKGRAFLCVGSETEEIQPMYADNTYYTPEELKDYPERDMAMVSLTGERRSIRRKKGAHASELETLVDYIARYTERSGIAVPPKIWPERLPDTLLLDELADPEENTLCAAVGLVDDPAEQKQYPLCVPLAKTGSFLVYGAGQTGKTTFLQTFTLSLLENNHPDTLDVYIVENIAGELAGFDAFPHVRRIAAGYSASKTIGIVTGILDERKKSGKIKGAKNILLVADNLNGILAENKPEILDIVQNGAGLGIYLVASAAPATGVNSISSVETLVKTGFSFWISQNAYDYRTPIHDNHVQTPPPSDIPGRGITSIGRVVSFQTARIAPDAERERFPEIVSARAALHWGAVPRKDGTETKPLESGDIAVGLSAESGDTIRHGFKTSASLLVIGDDRTKRRAFLRSAAEQLFRTAEGAEILAVGSTPEHWRDMPRVRYLCDGAELENYLSAMRDELVRRNKDPNAAYPPFVFLFDDFTDSLRSCTEETRNRIDKNLLLNAARFSVFTVAGCSYADFDRRCAEETAAAASSGGSGKEIVPLTRAAVGKCLLLDAKETDLNAFFRARYAFAGDGTYYLGGGKAEAVKRVTEKEE